MPGVTEYENEPSDAVVSVTVKPVARSSIGTFGSGLPSLSVNVPLNVTNPVGKRITVTTSPGARAMLVISSSSKPLKAGGVTLIS